MLDITPAKITTKDNGFIVEGRAIVDAAPHRSIRDAGEIALRIADDFRYLAACNEMSVPGVTDIRIQHERAAKSKAS